MRLRANLRTAARALKAHKLRSALTALGVIIGVAAVIAMVAVGAGARARVAEQMESLGSNLLVVLPGSATGRGVRLGSGTRPSITEDDALAIQREVPAVLLTAPTVRGTVQAVHGNRNWSTSVLGVTAEFLEAREWDVVAGQPFMADDVARGANVALIGHTVARELFGDTDPVGGAVRILRSPFTVAGVLATKGQSAWSHDQDDIILIPLASAKRKLLGTSPLDPGTVSAIIAKAQEAGALEEAREHIRALLRQRHRLQPGQPDDFQVKNLSAVVGAREESTRVLTALLAAIASVSLLVGGIGIMNIMLVSVTERTREIGVRMAIGARGRDILVQFLAEALALSLVGGGIGAGLGVAVASGIARVAHWRTVIEPEAILLAFAFAGTVGILFGLYPARRASRLRPVEALRSS